MKQLIGQHGPARAFGAHEVKTACSSSNSPGMELEDLSAP